MTYNVLLYLLCVVLAARMRDLRITLEDMRERKDGKGVREVAGPVMCGLWRTQKLLNAYLGPPVMVIAAVMILAVIINTYESFATRPVNAHNIVYGLTDFLNLVYLCCAPGMVHDQVRAPLCTAPPVLALGRSFAIFYNVNCSSDLANSMPPLLMRPRYTRLSFIPILPTFLMQGLISTLSFIHSPIKL